MTEEECGCRCRDCVEQDIHRCRRKECGYTKYMAMTRHEEQMESAGEAIEHLRGILKVAFKRLQPKQRERLNAWGDVVAETAAMDDELREAKRREKWAEIFG